MLTERGSVQENLQHRPTNMSASVQSHKFKKLHPTKLNGFFASAGDGCNNKQKTAEAQPSTLKSKRTGTELHPIQLDGKNECVEVVRVIPSQNKLRMIVIKQRKRTKQNSSNATRANLQQQQQHLLRPDECSVSRTSIAKNSPGVECGDEHCPIEIDSPKCAESSSSVDVSMASVASINPVEYTSSHHYYDNDHHPLRSQGQLNRHRKLAATVSSIHTKCSPKKIQQKIDNFVNESNVERSIQPRLGKQTNKRKRQDQIDQIEVASKCIMNSFFRRVSCDASPNPSLEAHPLSNSRSMLEKHDRKRPAGSNHETDIRAMLLRQEYSQSLSFELPTRTVDSSLYTLAEFCEMWRLAEVNMNSKTEDIEKGRLVRHANTRVPSQDSDHQGKAQYGRILAEATSKIFEILDLKRTDVFVDFGHGIGNAVLQAAYTVGCEARGIEVIGDRNFIAQLFQQDLDGQRNIHMERDDRTAPVGNVKLRHGELQAAEHREFLTRGGAGHSAGAIKALANNFNEVFASRALKGKAEKYTIDSYLAGLFALMKPGSVLVTLHPLDLGPSRTAVNEYRSRIHLPESPDASFYVMDKISLGEARHVVSWSQNGGNKNDIFVYVYKRVQQQQQQQQQQHEDRGAVFLCTNPDCDKALRGIPISATKVVQVKGSERIVINNCDCNYAAKVMRHRSKDISYKETK